MTGQDAYVMLISSLPRSEQLFLAKQPPLSRLRLEERLRILIPEDSRDLRIIEKTLNWRSLSMQAADDEVVAQGVETLSSLQSSTLREIVRERLEMRTVLSALRRRARGDGPPDPKARWGLSGRLRHISNNWADPFFGLGLSFPWIKEADRLLAEKDPVGLERLILDQSYKLLERHAAQHQFDFEAVVIYVLKWNIFDRWAQANGEAALRRFDDMAEKAFSSYEQTSFAGDAE